MGQKEQSDKYEIEHDSFDNSFYPKVNGMYVFNHMMDYHLRENTHEDFVEGDDIGPDTYYSLTAIKFDTDFAAAEFLDRYAHCKPKRLTRIPYTPNPIKTIYE